MAELQTDNNEEVIDALLHRIESKSSTDTVNSLKRINKILKREEFRNVFAEKGGIKRLISRLEAGLSEHASPSSATTVVNVKLKNDIIELILCTLVTAALKDESCKEKVCKTNERRCFSLSFCRMVSRANKCCFSCFASLLIN